MQALVTAQARARIQRIRMGSEGIPNQQQRKATDDDLFRQIYNVSFITALNYLLTVENEISIIYGIYNLHDGVKFFFCCIFSA